MTTRSESPFNNSSLAYYSRGWYPFPLSDFESGVARADRYRGKKSPPSGYTGRDGVNATRADIDAWLDERRYFNIGTRMPVNVVAIDVDAYHGGDKTLAILEAKLGKLPATFTVTARSDGSGHRYFAVPEKRVWRNPGDGIDILHWGWRYAVLPPSIHPTTGTAYTWFGPKGGRLVNPLGPRPQQLVPLPAAWVDYLDTKADPNAVAVKADLDDSELIELLDEWCSDDEPCRHMKTALKNAFDNPPGGRHDACMRAQMSLLRYGERGHPGARTAIDELQDWFYAALTGERDPSSEWKRGLVNAVQRIAGDPTPEGLHGCLAQLPAITTNAMSFTTRVERISTTSPKKRHDARSK
ncbi:bifunctional DNA primase/polymerase [Streptosporangium canum]|uniref:bifunctional DNA primase/polymerase n=1 Tax=Streptosporangium canum TaxID=324952 RepID=UPI0033A372D1